MSLADSQAASAVVGFLVWVLAIAAYWAPTIVSVSRRLPDTGTVAVWNFFAFFLLFPWIIALAKACRSRPVPPQFVVPPGWQPPPPR